MHVYLIYSVEYIKYVASNISEEERVSVYVRVRVHVCVCVRLYLCTFTAPEVFQNICIFPPGNVFVKDIFYV